MLVRNSLYGLNSSGKAFRDFLADILYAMGFRTSYANMGLWLRPVVNPDRFE